MPTVQRTLQETITVAQVGSFKRRSSDDSIRWMRTVTWLLHHESEIMSKTKFKHDVVNLKYGRDFLREEMKYDIVLLHSIFDPGPRPSAVGAVNISKWKETLISTVHNDERWRWRLVNTEAEYIFIWETYPMSINGWAIGELQGYKILHRDWEYTVYRKEVMK